MFQILDPSTNNRPLLVFNNSHTNIKPKLFFLNWTAVTSKGLVPFWGGLDSGGILIVVPVHFGTNELKKNLFLYIAPWHPDHSIYHLVIRWDPGIFHHFFLKTYLTEFLTNFNFERIHEHHTLRTDRSKLHIICTLKIISRKIEFPYVHD